MVMVLVCAVCAGIAPRRALAAGTAGAFDIAGAAGGAGAASTQAADHRVFDEAGLLDAEQVQALEAQIAAARETMNLDLVLVTTEDTGSDSSEEYADWYYDSGGFGIGRDDSGVLLLMDMDNRQLYVSTAGAMERFLTDERIETMMDRAIPYMQQGDYAGAAGQMVSDVETFYHKGIPGGQYNYDRETGQVSRYRSIRWYEALLALGAALITGGGACMSVKRDYAMEQEQRQAANYHMAYRAGAQFDFRNRNDALIDQFVVQNVIARTTGRGRGPGGFGGGGGGGRSTIHTSRSGRTHGGGGRGF